jgi:glutamate synthase domain-containing protein 3
MQENKEVIKMEKIKMPFNESEAVTINALRNGSILSYKELNHLVHEEIKKGSKNIILDNVCGQRFIGAALQGDLKIFIKGVPGNDLGIFMDGPEIFVEGNLEDQAGNTMNDGKIIVNGRSGDVTGFSARGGEFYIKGNVGYRIGIHVKEYKGHMPKIVIGGACKEYLGEYMAGGLIIVLGLEINSNGVKDLKTPLFGNCLGSGIHGGSIYIRTNKIDETLLGIGAKVMEFTDKKTIEPYIKQFCSYFQVPENIIWKMKFQKVQAASKRPYGSNYCKDLV